jgi:hypothetical protein
MAQSMLPPRGFFIPTHMIYKSQMPPAVFVTWLQLRSLTWSGPVIPPFAISEWIDLTGISRPTLIRHLNWLQKMKALKWQSNGGGMISVSFNGISLRPHQSLDEADELTLFGSMADSRMGSSKMDSPKMDCPSSLNPLSSTINRIDVMESQNQESDQFPIPHIEADGEVEGKGARLSNFGQTDHAHSGLLSPAALYRSIVQLTPNSTQRRLLASKITDLPLWQATIEHWIFHGWNPRNLAGMLDLYNRGGPSACRSCHPASRTSIQVTTSQPDSHAALEDLRRELGVASQADPSDHSGDSPDG